MRHNGTCIRRRSCDSAPPYVTPSCAAEPDADRSGYPNSSYYFFFAVLTGWTGEYVESWNAADKTGNPIVADGNVFGAEVTDRGVNDNELFICIKDTGDADFIAEYFQEFDIRVKNFADPTMFLDVRQVIPSDAGAVLSRISH